MKHESIRTFNHASKLYFPKRSSRPKYCFAGFLLHFQPFSHAVRHERGRYAGSFSRGPDQQELVGMTEGNCGVDGARRSDKELAITSNKLRTTSIARDSSKNSSYNIGN